MRKRVSCSGQTLIGSTAAKLGGGNAESDYLNVFFAS
tara:strand:+ start:130 stop:240 length:111 start_codon:yes stop_codon:yes gene_type:complete